MPNTHYAASSASNSKRESKKTGAEKKRGQRKSARNPFEYRESSNKRGENHDFNARKNRNRKADKARSRAQIGRAHV